MFSSSVRWRRATSFERGRGWDISLPDGRDLWGYVLQRGDSGPWQIVDAGVS